MLKSHPSIHSLEPSEFQNSAHQLFVGGLSKYTTGEDLHVYFSRFGQLLDCQIHLSKNGKSKQYGFITFFERDSVQSALASSPHILSKRMLKLERAHATQERQEIKSTRHHRKIFIGDIPHYLNNRDVKRIVNQYGAIETITRFKQTCDGKRFCYVVLSHMEVAMLLVQLKSIPISQTCPISLEVRQFSPKLVGQANVEEPKNMWINQNRIVYTIFQGPNSRVKPIISIARGLSYTSPPNELSQQGEQTIRPSELRSHWVLARKIHHPLLSCNSHLFTFTLSIESSSLFNCKYF